VAKKAEDSNSIIIRAYEIFGRDGDAVFVVPGKPKKAFEADMQENTLTPLVVDGNTVKARFGKYEIKTIKVEY
jgi:alpha-mannosidase